MNRVLMLLLIVDTSISCPRYADAQPARYRCIFEAKENKPFTLEFTFDMTTHDAMIVGNVGVGQVVMYAGPQATSFVELVPSGAVQTTTIAADGVAVHSRHTLLSDGFAQSQMIGTCSLN